MLLRHSSGVSETHLNHFPATSTGPLLSKCHEACRANPRPFLAATGARDFRKYRKPWRSAGPVHRFDRRCDSVWQHQVRAIQAVRKTKEVTQDDFSRTVRPVSLAMELGFSTSPLPICSLKCDNFVSPFKHALCAPGCCHDKLLALLLKASARKVNNERLRCA